MAAIVIGTAFIVAVMITLALLPTEDERPCCKHGRLWTEPCDACSFESASDF